MLCFAGLLLVSGMVELMFPFVASFYVNSLIFRLCCYWAKIFKQCSSSFACVAQEKAKEGLKTYYIRILPGFASRWVATKMTMMTEITTMFTMITFGEFSESFLNSEENSDGVGARCCNGSWRLHYQHFPWKWQRERRGHEKFKGSL